MSAQNQGSHFKVRRRFRFVSRKTVLSLTRTYPESYIHTRTEDVGKAGSLFASNDGSLPWWSTLFPDVCVNIHQLIPYHARGFPLM
jgi:hypothetical protein